MPFDAEYNIPGVKHMQPSGETQQATLHRQQVLQVTSLAIVDSTCPYRC